MNRSDMLIIDLTALPTDCAWNETERLLDIERVWEHDVAEIWPQTGTNGDPVIVIC